MQNIYERFERTEEQKLQSHFFQHHMKQMIFFSLMTAEATKTPPPLCLRRQIWS